jgi:hypothetical protein
VKRVVALLLATVAALVLAEIACTAYLRMVGDAPSGGEDDPGFESERLRVGEKRASDDELLYTLHPVLGFIRPPAMPIDRIATRARLKRLTGSRRQPEWADLTANNFGFFSRTDYPFGVAEDEAVIGVFGGSVAQWFALQGAETLAADLGRSQFFAGRRIRISVFAQGSFKQPQQLATLSFFLAKGQRFDAVVNIDGFNELALGFENRRRGVDAALPSSRQLELLAARIDGTASDQLLEAMLEARRARRALDEAERRAAVGGLAVVRVVNRWRLSAAGNRFVRAVERLDGQTLSGRGAAPFVLNPAPPPADDAAELRAVDEMIGIWASSSQQMNDILDGIGVPYLHVIQPNQYATGHRFTTKERRRSVDPSSRYRRAVELGYPRLEQRAAELRRSGVPVVSAIGLFDAERDAVFADTCCHYTRLGNELLAEFVARQLLLTLED